jgi:hypothetical protein
VCKCRKRALKAAERLSSRTESGMVRGQQPRQGGQARAGYPGAHESWEMLGLNFKYSGTMGKI